MVNGCIMPADCVDSSDDGTRRFHQITSSNGLCYYNRLLRNILPSRDEWKCAYKLPFGWEMAIHSTGRVYYLNHINQEVSWKRPGVCNVTSNYIAVLPIQPLQKQVGLFIVNRRVERMLASTAMEKKTSSLKAKKRFFHNLRTNKKKKHNKVRFEEVVHENNNNRSEQHIYSNWSPPTNHQQDMSTTDEDNTKQEQEDQRTMDMVLGTFDLHVEDDRDQVQVFRYYANTTASDLLLDACNQRQLCSDFFSLVMMTSANLIESMQESFGRIATVDDDVIIAPWDLIAEVAVNPRFINHRCRLRITYIPKDIHKMARDEAPSFLYLYRQSVHDVISHAQLQAELSEEKLVELRAIELVETCLDQQVQEEEETLAKKSLLDLRKAMIKFLDKKSADVSFMPHSMSDMQSLRKELHQKTKSVMDESFVSACAFEEKLRKLRIDYLKILSPCHYFGGACFDSVIQGKSDYYVTLVIGRHYGISQLINPKTRMLSVFATFSDVITLDVAPHNDQPKTNVRVELKKMAPLLLSLDTRQAVTFALLIYGYCRLKLNDSMMLILPVQQFFNSSPDLPDYTDLHRVFRSGWNDPCPDPTSSSSSLYLCKFSSKLNLVSDAEIPMAEREQAQQVRNEATPTPNDRNLAATTDTSSTSSSESEDDDDDSRSPSPPRVKMRSHTTVPSSSGGANTLPTTLGHRNHRTSTFKPGQPLADAVTPSTSSQPHVVGAELTWGEDDDLDSDSGSLKKRRSKFFSISRKSSKRSYSINDVSDAKEQRKKKNFVRTVFSRPKSFKKKMSRLYSAPDGGGGDQPGVISRLFSRIRRHQSSYDLNADAGADGQRYFALDGALDMTQSNTLPRKAKNVDGGDFFASDVARRRSDDGMISPPSEATPSVEKADSKKSKETPKKQKTPAPKVPVKDLDSVSDVSQDSALKQKEEIVSQDATPKKQKTPAPKIPVKDSEESESSKDLDSVSDVSQDSALKRKEEIVSQDAAPKKQKMLAPKVPVKDAEESESSKDEDSDSDVSQDAAPKKQKTPAPKVPVKDEDSVSDVSQDSAPKEQKMPAPKIPVKNSEESESSKDLDSDSDVSQDAAPKKQKTPAPKVPVKDEDSVSDVSQDSAPKKQKMPAPKVPVKDSEESESSKDEDSDSDVSQDAAPKKQKTPAPKVPVKDEDSVSDVSQDSAPKNQKTPAPKVPVKDEDSDSDVSQDSAPKEHKEEIVAEEVASSSSEESDAPLEDSDVMKKPQEDLSKKFGDQEEDAPKAEGEREEISSDEEDSGDRWIPQESNEIKEDLESSKEIDVSYPVNDSKALDAALDLESEMESEESRVEESHILEKPQEAEVMLQPEERSLDEVDSKPEDRSHAEESSDPSPLDDEVSSSEDSIRVVSSPQTEEESKLLLSDSADDSRILGQPADADSSVTRDDDDSTTDSLNKRDDYSPTDGGDSPEYDAESSTAATEEEKSSRDDGEGVSPESLFVAVMT